jgi:D-alanyl-D-alanine carboxypeptidase/D-alanyl-D-alanine-endopeptidase (penicillin-binding protein 4)
MSRRVPSIAGAQARRLVVAVVVAACACSPSSGRPERARGTTPPPAAQGSNPPTGSTPEAPAPSEPIITVRPSRAPWTRAIEAAVGGSDVSVAVGTGSRIRFLHLGGEGRIPASNQKLLTSMAALDTFGSSFRFPTTAVSRRAPRDGVIGGDLFVVGSGDPEIDASAIARLAARIGAAGVRRIRGSVVGDTSAFTREWWAPGWVPGLSRSFVNRTTALAFDGNAGAQAPELAAAVSLTTALGSLGVTVDGEPEAGKAPETIVEVARIESAPLATLLTTQNHGSVNFHAEMLLKALGAAATGDAGSTATGAAAVERWAEDRGIRAQVRDGSGLSYEDRISASDLVRLLLLARREPWGDDLVSSLPGPGEGTIGGRLAGLPVRAKTGTLFEVPVSSLAGSVTDSSGSPVEFAIISRGIDKTSAISIEDEIVRILARSRVG